MFNLQNFKFRRKSSEEVAEDEPSSEGSEKYTWESALEKLIPLRRSSEDEEESETLPKKDELASITATHERKLSSEKHTQKSQIQTEKPHENFEILRVESHSGKEGETEKVLQTKTGNSGKEVLREADNSTSTRNDKPVRKIHSASKQPNSRKDFHSYENFSPNKISVPRSSRSFSLDGGQASFASNYFDIERFKRSPHRTGSASVDWLTRYQSGSDWSSGRKQKREAPPPGSEINVETAVFVDKDLVQYMGRIFAEHTEKELVKFVLTMVNAVSNNNKRPP